MKEDMEKQKSGGQKSNQAHMHTNTHMVAPKREITDGTPFSYWLDKHHYYYYRLKKWYRFAIPEGSQVLLIQCKNGYLLDAIKPSYGVGIDTDAAVIDEAKNLYPRLDFYVGTIADLPLKKTFDYIVLPAITVDCYDVQALLESLKPFCHAGTRIIIDTFSAAWQPLLVMAQKCGLAQSTPFKNWLNPDDIKNFLYLSDYQIVQSSRDMLLPFYLPLLSTLCNTLLAHVPLLNRLCLHHMIIARPLFAQRPIDDYTVSVIVPCRNEKGNIEDVAKRLPYLGKYMEIIFVEGNSHDGTLQEIEAVIKKYSDRSISVYVQKGKGKGEAVRMGFERAIGDILIILDADLTVMPEEIPKFYYALVQNKGEFINGSRLIYQMEQGAMQFLGMIANLFFGKLFSWLLGQHIKDTLCGTKVLWRNDYQTIAKNRFLFGNLDPFGDFDLLFGAARLHLKLIDMPVHYKNRTYGTTQIRKFYYVWVLLAMSLLAIKKFKCR